MKSRREPGGSGKCSPRQGGCGGPAETLGDTVHPARVSWTPRQNLPAPRAAREISGRALQRAVRRRRGRAAGTVGPEPGVPSSPGVLLEQEQVGLARGAGAEKELEPGGDWPEAATSMRPFLCLSWRFSVWMSVKQREMLPGSGRLLTRAWFYACVGLSDRVRTSAIVVCFVTIIECGCVTGGSLFL